MEVMEPTLTVNEIKDYDRWNHSYISPGYVGSVGDCLITERLRRSNAEMAPDLVDIQEGQNIGSHIQDGLVGGVAPRTALKFWKHDLKDPRGWVIQDLKNVDRRTMEFTGFQPQYGWRDTVGSIIRAQTTGEGFLPLPNGYQPPEKWVPRGGLVPTIQQAGENVAATNTLNKRIYTNSGFNLSAPVNYGTTLGGVTYSPPASTGLTTTNPTVPKLV